nr:hypothetical protein [uncultured Rhodoferax sp.]
MAALTASMPPSSATVTTTDYGETPYCATAHRLSNWTERDTVKEAAWSPPA